MHQKNKRTQRYHRLLHCCIVGFIGAAALLLASNGIRRDVIFIQDYFDALRRHLSANVGGQNAELPLAQLFNGHDEAAYGFRNFINAGIRRSSDPAHTIDDQIADVSRNLSRLYREDFRGENDRLMRFFEDYNGVYNWVRTQDLAQQNRLADLVRDFAVAGENTYKGYPYQIHVYKRWIDDRQLIEIEPRIADGHPFRDAIVERNGQRWYLEAKNMPSSTHADHDFNVTHTLNESLQYWSNAIAGIAAQNARHFTRVKDNGAELLPILYSFSTHIPLDWQDKIHLTAVFGLLENFPDRFPNAPAARDWVNENIEFVTESF